MAASTHYSVLDISINATSSDIKKAYHKLAKLYHPDKTNSDGEMFKRINEAYATLSEAASREKYDKKLQASRSLQPVNRSEYTPYGYASAYPPNPTAYYSQYQQQHYYHHQPPPPPPQHHRRPVPPQHHQSPPTHPAATAPPGSHTTSSQQQRHQPQQRSYQQTAYGSYTQHHDQYWSHRHDGYSRSEYDYKYEDLNGFHKPQSSEGYYNNWNQYSRKSGPQSNHQQSHHGNGGTNTRYPMNPQDQNTPSGRSGPSPIPTQSPDGPPTHPHPYQREYFSQNGQSQRKFGQAPSDPYLYANSGTHQNGIRVPPNAGPTPDVSSYTQTRSKTQNKPGSGETKDEKDFKNRLPESWEKLNYQFSMKDQNNVNTSNSGTKREGSHVPENIINVKVPPNAPPLKFSTLPPSNAKPSPQRVQTRNRQRNNRTPASHISKAPINRVQHRNLSGRPTRTLLEDQADIDFVTDGIKSTLGAGDEDEILDESSQGLKEEVKKEKIFEREGRNDVDDNDDDEDDDDFEEIDEVTFKQKSPAVAAHKGLEESIAGLRDFKSTPPFTQTNGNFNLSQVEEGLKGVFGDGNGNKRGRFKDDITTKDTKKAKLNEIETEEESSKKINKESETEGSNVVTDVSEDESESEEIIVEGPEVMPVIDNPKHDKKWRKYLEEVREFYGCSKQNQLRALKELDISIGQSMKKWSSMSPTSTPTFDDLVNLELYQRQQMQKFLDMNQKIGTLMEKFNENRRIRSSFKGSR